MGIDIKSIMDAGGWRSAAVFLCTYANPRDAGRVVADCIDTTHMQSPGRRREYIAGLIDNGEASFEINYIPGSDTDILLRTLMDSGETVQHRITFPNGVTVNGTKKWSDVLKGVLQQIASMAFSKMGGGGSGILLSMKRRRQSRIGDDKADIAVGKAANNGIELGESAFHCLCVRGQGQGGDQPLHLG
ncbi:phage tail tube protein [Neorhizobium sp. SOG26]|uniref:phage tail tube protein n=1 Tax=Neorhizobium sp. SOG26 TaxID=2060726 RepID=UPI0018FF5F8C|nr:phage tail tube protein [Neorhizobium sp. SOG26]